MKLLSWHYNRERGNLCRYKIYATFSSFPGFYIKHKNGGEALTYPASQPTNGFSLIFFNVMKRIVTGFFSLLILASLIVNSDAQILSRATLNSRMMPQASATTNTTAGTPVSSIFLNPSKSALIPLSVNLVDSAFNFQDTTGGNWWLTGYHFDEPTHINAPGDTSYDSIGPIGVNLGNGTTAQIPNDTIYYRVMGERFNTPTDITALSARIDSVAITFDPISVGPNDSIEVWVVPMEDVEFSRGGQSIGDYPVPDLFGAFAKGVINASDMTAGSLNTLTAVFAKGGVSLSRRTEFGVCAIVTGPDFPADTVAYQFDANISPYLGSSLQIDTDGSLNGTGIPMDTYLGLLDAGNVVYQGSPLGTIGALSQFWGFDLQTEADPTMAFEGNMVAVAYLHGTAAGVTNDPTSSNILGANYPNPVSTTTDISYNLESSGPVTMNVFNALGQNVGTVVNSIQGAGQHIATFNAGTLPDGIYYYTIQSGEFTATNAMVIAR